MHESTLRQRRWIVGSIAWVLATGLLAYGFIVAVIPSLCLCGFGIDFQADARSPAASAFLTPTWLI